MQYVLSLEIEVYLVKKNINQWYTLLQRVKTEEVPMHTLYSVYANCLHLYEKGTREMSFQEVKKSFKGDIPYSF